MKRLYRYVVTTVMFIPTAAVEIFFFCCLAVACYVMGDQL